MLRFRTAMTATPILAALLADDPPDQISPTYIGFTSTCADGDITRAEPMWDVSRGQVTVW